MKNNLKYYYIPGYKSVTRLHNPCLNDKSEIYRMFNDYGSWVYNISEDDLYEGYRECIEIVVNNFRKELIEECDAKFAKVTPWKEK